MCVFLPNCVCVCARHTWQSFVLPDTHTAHLLTTALRLPRAPPTLPFVLSNFGAHVFMPQMALLRQRILFFTATFRHFALSFLFSASCVGVARALRQIINKCVTSQECVQPRMPLRLNHYQTSLDVGRTYRAIAQNYCKDSLIQNNTIYIRIIFQRHNKNFSSGI